VKIWNYYICTWLWFNLERSAPQKQACPWLNWLIHHIDKRTPIQISRTLFLLQMRSRHRGHWLRVSIHRAISHGKTTPHDINLTSDKIICKSRITEMMVGNRAIRRRNINLRLWIFYLSSTGTMDHRGCSLNIRLWSCWFHMQLDRPRKRRIPSTGKNYATLHSEIIWTLWKQTRKYTEPGRPKLQENQGQCIKR